MEIKRRGVIKISKHNIEILGIILILVVGCAPWFIWGYTSPIYVGCVGALLLAFVRLRKIGNVIGNSKYSLVNLAVLLYFLYFVVFQFVVWGDFAFSTIYLIVALLFTIGITDDTKEKAYDKFVKLFAIVVLISLVAWAIHKFIVEFPIISYLDISEMKGARLIMNNHLFFVSSEKNSERFYGVFDEPGVLGTIGAFILYANKYDFKKWYNIALLVACFFTFSLAFFIMTIVGMFFTYSQTPKDVIRGIFGIVIVVLIVYIFLWDNPDFQRLIVGRLTSVDDISGLISNRENLFVQENFANMLSDPITLLLGYGNNSTVGAGTAVSYMRWLLQYGFVGFAIMCFVLIVLLKEFNKNTLVFFVLWMMAFSQRPNIFSTAYVVLIVVLEPIFNKRQK